MKILKKRLLNSTKRVNPDSFNKTQYHGKMGRGFIDAQLSLTDYDSNFMPASPKFIENMVKPEYHAITVSWKADVTDESETNIESYILYISDKAINENNYRASYIKQIEILAKYASKDNVFTQTISQLESGKPYYIALQSFAINGKHSKLIILNPIETKLNRPPLITPNINLDKEFVIAGNDILEINFNIIDEDNHKWSYSLDYEKAIFTQREDNKLRIRIFANKFIIGNHSIKLTVVDEYGGESTEIIKIKVNKDNPPRPIENLSSFSVALFENKTFSLSDFIVDEEKDKLVFNIENLNNDFVTLSLIGDQLTMYPKRKGKTELIFTATDKHNQKVTITIPIFIYTNTGIYNLYPTVATNIIYLRVGDVIKGKVKLRVRNIMGKEVLKEEFATDSIDPIKRTIAINIDKLYPGKYELSIINGNESYTENFIKE